MNFFRQIGIVTLLGLRSLPDRLGSSLVIVIGMTCAVGALVSILSMSTGLLRTVDGAGRDDRVVVLSKNSNEASGSLSRDNALLVGDAPGVRKTTDGKAIISAEIIAFAPINKKGDGLNAFMTVRGVGPQGSALRPEIKLISGRMFTPGKYEVIVGKSAQAQFEGLDVGKQVALPEGDWTVTGVFESNGDAHQSEVFADAPTLLSALRKNNFSVVTAMLDSRASFDTFKKALTSNPRLSVDVQPEKEYLRKQWADLNGILTMVAYVVGGIMGLGALFGALNTMYSAVSTRTLEIATLRALGFGGTAVVISVLVESLVLAMVGALLGAGIAWLLFSGNAHGFDGLIVTLAVTPALVMLGVAFACGLGFIGALFPLDPRRTASHRNGIAGSVSGVKPFSEPTFHYILKNMIAALQNLLRKNVRYSTVIDVGCADGQFFLYIASLGLFPGAVPLHIDANALYEGSLQIIKGALGGDYRICAVTDHEGEIEMTTSSHPYWSSLKPPDDPYWTRINNLSEAKMTVQARTLDSLRQELSPKPPLLLKLDVQGAEEEALRGATNLLKDTHVVICETGVEDFQAVNKSMLERNFILYDLTQLHRAQDGTLGWFYPIYVNRGLDFVFSKNFWKADQNQELIDMQVKRREDILKALPELISRAKNPPQAG